MFDYPHLEVLLAVEREGNFERAAKTQGVSKPAISQTLKLLDLRMGVVTVDRDSTQTTYFGNKLCRHFEHVRLLEQKFFDDNADLFNVFSQPPVTIKVAVNDDCISSWFTDVVTTTYSVQRKLFIDVIKTDQDESKKLMVDAKISAGISTSNTPLPGFTCYPLGQQVYRATASPEFANRFFSNGVTIEALATAPSVRFDADDKYRRLWVESVFDKKLDLPASNIHSAHGIAKVCVEGSAWGMNPALLVDSYIASGELVELIPNQIIAQNLYWHISQTGIDTLAPLTQSVRRSARAQLYQEPVKS